MTADVDLGQLVLDTIMARSKQNYVEKNDSRNGELFGFMKVASKTNVGVRVPKIERQLAAALHSQATALNPGRIWARPNGSAG